MITILNILILAVTAFFTLSLLPHFLIMGTVALLPLLFIIQLAYYRKGFEPLLLAALSGIFFDLYSAYPFGFYLVFFLGTALLVRFFFDEGMRQLSFWHYVTVVTVAMLVYYLAQIGWLYFGGHLPTLMIYYPLVWGFAVNLGFAVPCYFLGVWYFDHLIILEDRLKRR